MKRLFAAVVVIAAIVSAIFLSGCATGPDWRVTDDGMLEYPDAECTPEYQLAMLETADNYSLYEVTFTSRGLLSIYAVSATRALHLTSAI